MVLSKDDILKGVKDPELIEIEALGGELPLRPLSKKEWNKIERIETKAYGKFEANETAIRAAQKGKRQGKKGESKMNTKGLIDLEKQTEAEFKGKTEALYLSMNNGHMECSEWKKEEIQELKSDAFDEIFEAIQELSGIKLHEDEDDGKSLKSEIDSFPED